MVKSIKLIKDRENIEHYTLYQFDDSYKYVYHDKEKEMILDESNPRYKLAKKLFEPYLEDFKTINEGDEKDIFLF